MNHSHQKRRVDFFAIVFIATLFYFWFAWPLVWTASQNLRLVDAFDVDEALHLCIVKGALNQHTFKIMFNNYGHLYFNLALLPLFFMSYVSAISEQHSIVVLRLVSTLAAVATVVSVFVLAKRFFGRLSAWLSALSLLIVPLLFNEYAINSHPDILQIFFIVLSLYFSCQLVEKKDFKWLVCASASAGLAFACKYSGIFLLFILWIVEMYNMFTRDRLELKPKEHKILKLTNSLMPMIGVAAIVIATLFTPEFTARYLTKDHQIADAAKIHFLNLGRLGCLIFGVGILLLKMIGLVLSIRQKTFHFMDNLNEWIFKCMLAFLVFGFSFFIASPYSFSGLNFVSGILFESRHTTLGHMYFEHHSKTLWFKEFVSPSLLGKFVFMVIVLELFLKVYAFLRKDGRPKRNPEIILWFWIFLYMGFLVFRVNMIRPRYLLPVLPICFILFSLPIKQLIEFIKMKLSRKRFISVAAAVFISIVCLEFPGAFHRLSQYRKETLLREETSSSVKAGKWIAKRCPASSRVLYDRFSYVPAAFTHVCGTWDATLDLLETFHPDIVMVNQRVSYPYDDIENAKTYIRGESHFRKRFEYYEKLRNGSAGFVLARDFGEVQVYQKAP